MYHIDHGSTLHITVFVDNIHLFRFAYRFKFLLDDPSVIPNTEVPVIESEEFCCVFKANLNGTKLLYGAEMDGIESNIKYDLNYKDLNELNFIELKVNLRAINERQKTNFFRYKLRNWWSQCFLANVEKILIGTRSENGIVNELSELDVKSIPRLVRVSSNISSFW